MYSLYTRSHDGTVLMFSSADGYCSAIVFSDGELGVKYEKQPEITVQEYDVEMMDIPSNPTPAQQEVNILQPHKRRVSTIPITISNQQIQVESSLQPEKPKKRRVTPTLISTTPLSK